MATGPGTLQKSQFFSKMALYSFKTLKAESLTKI
jgi:hypothetical protein